MLGETMRTFRESLGLNQSEFAGWLNEKMSRRYDKQKISSWERGAERVPQAVATLLAKSLSAKAAEQQTGPAFIIAVANQKGGVGKTTSSVNIASALALRGYKVALVDTDPQASATRHLGINPLEHAAAGKTVHQALQGTVKINDILVEIPNTGLLVAPSSISLAKFDAEGNSEAGADMILREVLEDTLNSLDFIVIDCPPNLGKLTVNSLAVANTVLIPCQTEPLALMGIDDLFESIRKTKRRLNPRLTVAGILPTMHGPNLVEDKTSLEQIYTEYGSGTRIFPFVQSAAIYPQSVRAGRAVVEAMPSAPGVSAYNAVAEALIEARNASVEVRHVA